MKIVLLDILKHMSLPLLEKNPICILNIFLDYIFRIKSNLCPRIQPLQSFLIDQTQDGFLLIPSNNLSLNQLILIISPMKHSYQLNFQVLLYKYHIHCLKSIHFASIDKSTTTLRILINYL